MSSTLIRARLLTGGGALLAAAALAAASLAGTAAFASTDAVTVEANVTDTITLVANDATIALDGAPGDTAQAASTLTVTTNNFSGYNVTATPGAAALEGSTVGNTDTIDIGALQLNSVAMAHDGETGTASEIYSQAEQSAEGGDPVNVDFDLAVPFVAADLYTVGLTFTASANS